MREIIRSEFDYAPEKVQELKNAEAAKSIRKELKKTYREISMYLATVEALENEELS